MKAIIPVIICLLVLSSCKKDAPDLPPEYEYIKGEWVAYETTVYTSDLHGGFIGHTIPVENYEERFKFSDDHYSIFTENIEKKYDLNDLHVVSNVDTNIIEFSTGYRIYYYRNEDILKLSGGISILFPEISSDSYEGGNTYYRRVQ